MVQRVVITGIGAISPIGAGKQAFWEGLLAGRLGYGEITSFNASAYRVNRGAEIPDFNAHHYLPDLPLQRYGRATQFALCAGKLAFDDAGLNPADVAAETAGVCMGTTSGEPNQIEAFNNHFTDEQTPLLGAGFIDRYPSHNIPANMAAEFGLTGVTPILTPAACAAGNYAIAHASDQIATGRVKLMLAGGSDAFSRITYTGFARIGAIAKDLCQPFDLNRKGMIPGEGAAVLVLESLQSAQARKAFIYAEVKGYGFSCDAWHMTGAHPEGRGAAEAMERAMNMAQITTQHINYISAHGTGTKSNDLNETTAVKRVFGERANTTPISSIKSMLGHTMGAASALETSACALAITHGIIPPTMNLRDPDPACDLDYVPNHARHQTVDYAMNNAYAFGGNNSSLILKRVVI